MSSYLGRNPVRVNGKSQSFTTTGLTSTYALTYNPGNSFGIDVFLDHAYQYPNIDYHVVNQNLVFVSTPAASKVVFIKYNYEAASIGVPGNQTVGLDQIDPSLNTTPGYIMQNNGII